MDDQMDFSSFSDYELIAFGYYQVFKMNDEERWMLYEETDKRSIRPQYEDFKTLMALEDSRENVPDKPKCPRCKTTRSKLIAPDGLLNVYSLIWGYYFNRYSIRRYHRCIICNQKYSIQLD